MQTRTARWAASGSWRGGESETRDRISTGNVAIEHTEIERRTAVMSRVRTSSDRAMETGLEMRPVAP